MCVTRVSLTWVRLAWSPSLFQPMGASRRRGANRPDQLLSVEAAEPGAGAA